jgi:hypothetical protein
MPVLGNKVIKSIQRGNANYYNESTDTVSINAVDLDKSFLTFGGPGTMRYTNSTNPQAGTFRAWLNSTTQISFYSTNSIYVLYYSWEVIEYE